MPNWKKVVTSGSNAVLNEITSSGGIYSAEDIYSRESKLGRDTYIERLLTLGTEPSEDTTTDTNIQFLSRDKGNGEIKHHTLGSNAFNSTAIPTVNNTSITISAQSSALKINGTEGGQETFTTNQGTSETIEIDHADTSTQGSLSNSGNTVIQSVSLDGHGHVTSMSSKTLTIPSAVTNNNQLTNGCGYITDGNTNWNNSYGFTTCTGTTTPSNTQTFTNKSGDISQWTNDSGYTTCTGTTTPSNSQTFTNKSGNISQWTNDAGYITDGNTGWNNSYGFTTCTGDITQVCITAGDGLTGDVNTTSGNHLQTIDVDSTVVRTSGTQTIGGDKTFNGAVTINGTAEFGDPVTIDSDLTLTGISTNTGHSGALVIDGTTGEVYSRTLGSNAFNSTAFTTCIGTVTPSSTHTFTNKSGNISQWTNDSGYTSCTGTTTPSNTQTFTNKSGNISQWTNDSGYTSCTGTSNLTLGTTAGTALEGDTVIDDVSVARLKTRLAGGFGSNAVQIGDSTDTVTIPGELVVTGTITTNNVETVSTSNGVVFEGSAADANEGLLLAGTLTSDQTYTLPDATGTIALKSQIPTHTSCITNDSGFITDGNTNWNNTYGFTTCTGTTTPSNTQTFTNKSGDISQWTNDSGYTTCTGTTTPSNTQTFTNKSGDISQWTNDAGYITDGNTNWNNSYGFTTCTGTVTSVTSANTDKIYVGGSAAAPTIDAKTGAVTNGGVNLATGDQIYDHVTTRISGLTSCTGTSCLTLTGGVNNRIVTAGSTTSLIGESGLTYDGSSFCVSSQGNFFEASCSQFGDDNAGLGNLVIGDDNFGGELGIMTDNDEAIAIKVGSCTFEFGGIEPFNSSIKVIANSHNVLLNKSNSNTVSGNCNIVGGYLNQVNSGYYSIAASGCNNCIGGGSYYGVIVGGQANQIKGNGSLCKGNFIGGGQTNCICMGHSQTIAGGHTNCISDDACAVKSESRANWATIGGGNDNHIDGSCYAFIGSGQTNCIKQSNAGVIAGGGFNDILTSNYGTIAGGYSNYISGTCSSYSTIGGGQQNSSYSKYASLAGGYNNCISGLGDGNYSTIGGGSSNETCSTYATVGGGYNNGVLRSTMQLTGCGGTIAGGYSNRLCANYATIGGGCVNTISCNGPGATINGGICNQNNSSCSTIGGGAYNCVVASQGPYSTIGGGYDNCISTSCCGQTIGGGKNNYICTGQYGQSGTIAGGCNNKVCGCNISSATVVGGSCNCAKATGTVVGGVSAVANHSYATVFGCCITSTAQKTAYFNNATVACHLQVGGTTTLSSTTGRIDATNDIVAYSTSDRRLKENIKPIENALCKVVGVTGNTFNWKELSEQEVKDIHGNKGNDVGVIAQEIEEILPQAVTTRDSGYKAVNYEKLVPLLIEAIKDQQKQIDELKDKVNGSS